MENDKRLDFMTGEEIKRVDEYLTKIEKNRGYMGDYYAEIEKIQEAYANNQPIIDNRPNSRVNVINANVEGQMSALVEQNLGVSTKGQGPSDEMYAKWAQVGLDWTFRQNYMRTKVIKPHERRRLLFGWAWLKVYFDPDAINGYGLVRYTCPPLQNMFIDLKITDFTRIQEAEYIAEVILKSKSWAEKQGRYKRNGKNMASYIKYGGSDKAPIFNKEKTDDDEDAFWLIQLWTKTDGILRLEEFSDDGVLLYDSFEDKEIQNGEGKKPYNRYNQYPYFLTILYPEEGKLYGFGDGRLLRPLQEMLNDLYDQVRRVAKPNRLFFDPDAEIEPSDIDDNDEPVPCNNPNENIKMVEVGKVNESIWRLITAIHEEVQRVTRFSDLMIGQSKASDTATEAAIQQQQGNAATDSKKIDLQDTLEEAAKYALDLMMDNYTEAKAFAIDEKRDEYMWIDFRQLNNIPAMVPATDAYIKQYQAKNQGAEPPKWMQLTDEKGIPMTKSVDLDIEINIGAGLPKNKAFLWQMAERLASLQVTAQDGTPQSVVSLEKLRELLEDWFGISLETEDLIAQNVPAAPVQPIQSPDALGLTQNANPMLSILPGGGGIGNYSPTQPIA